jgi:DNA-binding IscR family transcriptional regulator
MTDRECSFVVLLSLFDLSRLGLPSTPERVAGRLDLSEAIVDAALARLATAGLVRSCRLTLPGLALASSLEATRASLFTTRVRRERLAA